MRARRGYRRRKGETTLALINIVFLMLVFFLVAGRIARPAPAEMTLARLSSGIPVAPPDTLAIRADGQLFWQGNAASAAPYAAALKPQPGGVTIARLMPDRDLAAETLLQVTRALRLAGASEVRLVGARAAP